MKLGVRGLQAAFILTVLAGLFHLPGCATRPRGGTATVEFRNPSQFSDLQIPGKSREQTVDAVLPRLQEVVATDAASSIPAGYVVHLFITEIDQSGFIANPGGAFPVRVTGDNSASVIAFDYVVNGPNGQEVKAGSQRLVQVPADLGPFLDDDSPVPLIEYMLNNWMGSLGWELSRSHK